MSPEKKVETLQTLADLLRDNIEDLQASMLSEEGQSAQGRGADGQLEDAEMESSSERHDPLPDFNTAVNKLKRELLSQALEQNHGVMKYAAESIGLKYTTFVEMANRLGVTPGHRTSPGDPAPRESRRDGRLPNATPVTLSQVGHPSVPHKQVA